jgi:predicted nuclease with TOPRIM domain
MDERREQHGKLSSKLARCETRLDELKGKGESDKLSQGLSDVEDRLKACRVKLDELEEKSEDDWLDAKHSVTKEIDDLMRSLQLSPDQMEDFIR